MDTAKYIATLEKDAATLARVIDTIDSIHRERHLSPINVPHPVGSGQVDIVDALWNIVLKLEARREKHCADCGQTHVSLESVGMTPRLVCYDCNPGIFHALEVIANTNPPTTPSHTERSA